MILRSGRQHGTRRSRAPFALALAAALAAAAPGTARAVLVTYTVSGTIESVDAGVLFPGKTIGESWSGTFTLDTGAMLQSTGNMGTLGTFTGEFAVVIEGVSYPVHALRVWSSGPSGIDDGIELAFTADGSSGFLSLRSGQELYLSPIVPASLDLAEFDEFAHVSLDDTSGLGFDRDGGSIETLPEPGGAAAGLAALAAVATLRRALDR